MESKYWSHYWNRRIDRRRTLGIAGTLGVSVAAAALVGCGDDDDGASGTNDDATASPQSAGTAASPGAQTAPDEGEPVQGGELTFATAGEPPHLDPTETLAYGLHTSIAPIYSRLIRTVWPTEAENQADFSLRPDIAEEWEQVDLQTYTFKIRPNAKWHNVEPLNARAITAADIKACLEAYKSKGAQTSAFDVVESIDTPDDQTVTIKMSEPYALFLETLSNPVRHIFPPEALERPDGLKGTPVLGSGPFIFQEYQRGDSFKGVRNPDYYDSPMPHIDGYTVLYTPDAATQVAAFRSDTTSIIGLTEWETVEDILGSNSDSVHVEGIASHSVFSPAMDLRNPPFNDVNVRRALSMATDRQATVDSLFSGHGITGWGVPWVFAQADPWSEEQLGEWHRYDPAEAKKLMSAAGYEDGFKTTMRYFPYFGSMEPQIQLFQAELQANLGVEIELMPLDYTTWFTEYTGMNWDGMAWGFQIGTSSSIDDFMFKNLHSESVANYYYITDPEIDRLVTAIRAEPDAEARAGMIKDVFAIDQDQMYRIHTPYPNGHAVAHPYLKGWQPTLQFRGLTTYGSAAAAAVWIER